MFENRLITKFGQFSCPMKFTEDLKNRFGCNYLFDTL